LISPVSPKQRVAEENGKIKSVLITAISVTADNFAHTFMAQIQVCFLPIISSLRKGLGMR
jgi:hypothetical protein